MGWEVLSCVLSRLQCWWKDLWAFNKQLAICEGHPGKMVLLMLNINNSRMKRFSGLLWGLLWAWEYVCCLVKQRGHLGKSNSSHRHCVCSFAILTEGELGKKGYQLGLRKGIALKQVQITEVIQKLYLWAYLAASEELVWTQASKWVTKWAWCDLKVQVLLETCVLFEALLPVWKDGIWRRYFICLWFSVKPK